MRDRRPLALRMPRSGRSFLRPVLGSLVVHIVGIGAIVWAGLTPLIHSVDDAGSEDRGAAGGGGGAGAEPTQIDLTAFLRAEAATEVPTRPRRRATFTRPVKITVAPARVESRVDLGPVVVAEDLLAAGLRGGAGAGTGRGNGFGSGTGTGVGPDSGAGRGADEDVVFPPKARYSILPPLPQPSSVRGQSFRVHFTVDTAGRVTGVEVDPDIPDESYSRRFVELMYDYAFEPARRPDGTAVDGETIITITL